MTPEESINFFAGQLERSFNGLAVAQASRNWRLAAVNYGQLFKCHLMQGLISWRLQQDPTQSLCKAVAVVADGISTLRTLSELQDAEKSLPIGKAALIASLTSKRFEVANAACDNLPFDLQLDFLLATSTPADTEPALLVAELSKGKRTSLAADTYQNYFDILASGGDSERIEELTKKGEVLFAKRARDSFFSGGDQTEGGGPDNSLVVDYRLAVALKRAGKRSNSLHAWAW